MQLILIQQKINTTCYCAHIIELIIVTKQKYKEKPYFTMTGSNKSNPSGSGKSRTITPTKTIVSQQDDEGSGSSSQSFSEQARLIVQSHAATDLEESNKWKYSNLGENTLLQNTDNSTDDGSWPTHLTAYFDQDFLPKWKLDHIEYCHSRNKSINAAD